MGAGKGTEGGEEGYDRIESAERVDNKAIAETRRPRAQTLGRRESLYRTQEV